MFKQTLATFIAVSGISTAAAAQTCAPPIIANMVDLKPVANSNLMTVPVAIDGKPKQFLLDIGANPDEIAEATATELHLQQIDRRATFGAMTGQNATFQFQTQVYDVKGTSTPKAYQPRVRVGAFTIGTATLHDMQFLVSSDRDLGKSKPYDGLLTAAGFRQYDMNLDFGGRKLSFLGQTVCADPNQIVSWPHTTVAVIPMTANGDKIILPVTIAGHPIDAVIDTSADHTVMRRAIAERLFGLNADTPDMMPYEDLRDGTGARVYQHTFSQIAFEGVTASNVPALIQANSMVRSRRPTVTGSRLQAAADPGEPIPDLALGMDVLSQLHLYAAFGQSKLYVTAK
jgi:predicted aspartyl protease